MNKVDLSSILTQHLIIGVTLAASSTIGKPLSEDKLEGVLKSCDIVEQLEYRKRRVFRFWKSGSCFMNKLLNYVQSTMLIVAPNLSNIFGTAVAAQLMGTAGRSDNLSRMSAFNIKVLGSQNKSQLRFSKLGERGVKTHHGLFSTMDMVKNAPPAFQKQLVIMFSTNCAKAARVNVSRIRPSGLTSSQMKSQLLKRFDRIQEMSQEKTKKKPPRAPHYKPRKKRGGKK